MHPDLTDTASELPFEAGGIAEILASEQLHSLFQPIVDLDTGAVVAYEALTGGPTGRLERPDDLFAAARASGLLSDLDRLCRTTALRGAINAEIFVPLTLFVNVEPEVVDPLGLEELLGIARDSPGELQVVLELTERDLAFRPAELLASVRRLRTAGWRIAMDDVGTDDLSLAFMPLLRPDVIKLDLRVVQHRPDAKVAGIMNAVNAHAERTGCLILAEGIEKVGHLALARALGASLGQGWFFGRPAAGPAPEVVSGALGWPPRRTASLETSPLACLPESVKRRRSTKPLLTEVSRHLERQAGRLGRSCLLISTFPQANPFTPSTARRYSEFAHQVGFVAAIGSGMSGEPAPGVRDADLAPGDPLLLEWDVVVLAPHFAGALVARDLGSGGSQSDRHFEFVLTYDREAVEAAARSLMSRIRPQAITPTRPTTASPARSAGEQVNHLDAGALVTGAKITIRPASSAPFGGQGTAGIEHRAAELY